MRRRTRVIHVGNVGIGGDNPIRIQSMTKTDTRDINTTIRQIHELECLGCEIIRVAVPDQESVDALPLILKEIHIPLIADIHFDWHLAVKAIEKGVHGIRINPGNLKQKDLGQIVDVAKQRNIPIRIGVNSGSLEKGKTLVGSALEYVKRIESLGYTQLKISVKAPDISRTIEAYQEISRNVDYPLHIGLTEAGPLVESAVRSSIAIGTLLMEGIGDTIRVSVTGPPHDEVLIAKEILQSLGLRRFGPQIISCPTCARCKVDLIRIVEELKDKLPQVPKKVAIMGCVVNGPGEARDADIGIAFGNGAGVLFKNGRVLKRVSANDSVGALVDCIKGGDEDGY